MVDVERGRDEFRKRLLGRVSSRTASDVALLAGDSKAAEQVAPRGPRADAQPGDALRPRGRAGHAPDRPALGRGGDRRCTRASRHSGRYAGAGARARRGRCCPLIEPNTVRCSRRSRASNTCSRSTWRQSCSSRPATRCWCSAPTCLRTHCGRSSRDHHPALFALSATMPEAGERVPTAVDAVIGARADIGLILGGASVPTSLALSPRVVVERSVAGIVEAADGLVRRARLELALLRELGHGSISGPASAG